MPAARQPLDILQSLHVEDGLVERALRANRPKRRAQDAIA
jgi:hypothetical protein